MADPTLVNLEGNVLTFSDGQTANLPPDAMKVENWKSGQKVGWIVKVGEKVETLMRGGTINNIMTRVARLA